MSIRIKLVGGFLAVALLVALLGGIAISRVNSINDDVETLTETAIPTTMRVQELDQIQRRQQIAVFKVVGSRVFRALCAPVDAAARLTA